MSFPLCFFLERPIGTDPFKSLSDRFDFLRLERVARASVIELLKLFLAKSNITRVDRLANLGGMVPFGCLLDSVTVIILGEES